MSWYAFHGYNNGKAINASAFDGAELNALGMHGYPTQAQAEAKPNSVNVFQAPVVNAAIDDYNNARDISPTQANNPSDITAPAKAGVNTAKKAAQNLPSWLTDLEKFIERLLPSRAFMIRTAEVVIGIGLILVSLDELAKGSPIGDAAHVAGKAVKVIK